MPVAIAGMHRSGTSLVARALNLAGCWLGAEPDMLPAAPDNPEGYWENAHFVRINERILDQLGSWDVPPQPAEGWAGSSRFASLRKEASAQVDAMQPHAPWGWKDPRTSLTAQFWDEIIDGLSVVICLRGHPR
jgi:Uncharacterized protein conserved in bacteria